MRFWHEVPLTEQDEILKAGGKTWAEFCEEFKQPEWCGYPDAMFGAMGCWSLMISKTIRSESNCRACDCRKVGG